MSRATFVRRTALAPLALLPLLAASPAAAQRALTVSGVAATAEHRVTGRGVERSSGLLVGGEASLAFGGWGELRVRGLTGSLSADGTEAEDQDVSQGSASLLVAPASWLAFDAGAQARTFSTGLATQRWVAARVGAEGRLRLTDDFARGVLRLAVLPSVSATGLPAPDLGLVGGAGVELERGRLSASAVYELERYDFSGVAGGRRDEQFSSLALRLGLRLGRR